MGGEAMMIEWEKGTPFKNRQECLVLVRLKTGAMVITVARYIDSFTEEAAYFFEGGEWNDGEVDIDREDTAYAKAGWYEVPLCSEFMTLIDDEVIGWTPTKKLVEAAEGANK